MKKIFTFNLAAALLALTASVAAQDANNPWHLIVINEDSTELAAFNVETLDNVSLSDGKVDIDLTWDSKSKSYYYPVATTFFTFEPRQVGTGTANEALAAPKWNVFYDNGHLHVPNPVGTVEIYSISGMLVGRYPNVSDFSVNLSSGLYIVRSGNQSAKLLVATTGTGSTTTQPVMLAPQTETYAPMLPATNLRAATIKIYWNITAGNTTMPIEIPNVEKFHFTADNSIVFTLKNGNTIEMVDYKGVEFDIEPAPVTTTSQWDMEKTLKFGGAAYGSISSTLDRKVEYVSVVHNKGVILWDIAKNQEVKYPKEGIASNIWTDFPNGRISAFVLSTGFVAGMTYEEEVSGGAVIYLTSFSTGQITAASLCTNWGHNNNTNIISSKIVQNADGSITVKYTNHAGVKREHTFKDW